MLPYIELKQIIQKPISIVILDKRPWEIIGSSPKYDFPDKILHICRGKKDFHSSECYRGSNYYDNVPIPTLPKTMGVISITDLGLENFIAKGIIVYKRVDILEEVTKILGI